MASHPRGGIMVMNIMRTFMKTGAVFIQCVFVVHLLSSPALCCDALLQARVVLGNQTTMLAGGSSGSSSSIKAIAPHFSRQTSRPFNITAMLYYPSLYEYASCVLPEVARSSIILTLQHSANFAAGCGGTQGICQSSGCVGVVWIFDQNPEYVEMGAQTIDQWHVVEAKYAVPIVAVARGSVGATWILEHVEEGNVQVTITSGDPNEFANVLKSLPWKIFNTLSAVHTVSNLLAIVWKATTFRGFAKKDIPRAVSFVLIPEILANCLRFMLWFNMGFFEAQLYPYTLFRVLMTAPTIPGVVSIMAMSILVYDSYQNATSTSIQRGYKRSRAAIVVMCLILVLDLSNLLYTAFAGEEAFSSTALAAFYLVLKTPVAIFFVRFGSSTAKLLNQHGTQTSEVVRSSPATNHTASAAAVARRDAKSRSRFAGQIKFTGIALAVNVVSTLAFAVLNKRSATLYLYTFSWAHETAAITSSLQIIAVRTPEQKQIIPEVSRILVAAVSNSLTRAKKGLFAKTSATAANDALADIRENARHH